MKIHISFGKKDADICRWSRCIPRRHLCYMLELMVSAYLRGKPVFIPDEPDGEDFLPVRLDVHMNLSDSVVIKHLKKLSPYQRSNEIKNIVRQQLWARRTEVNVDSLLNGVDENKSNSEKKEQALSTPAVPVNKSTESEEESQMLQSLLTMAGD